MGLPSAHFMLQYAHMAQRPITPEGYERLNDELQHLWHQERPRVVQEVSEAAAHGDRSENAEYIYGKKRLREIDRRVRHLSRILDTVEVVDPTQFSGDRVEFGATVTFEDEEGHSRTLQLVGEDEGDVKAGRVSLKSPLGVALMGKKVGDETLLRRPKGDIWVTILKVEYGTKQT